MGPRRAQGVALNVDAVNQALALIDRYGLAIVGLVALAAFAVWLTRQLMGESARRFDEELKRHDRTLDIADRQVTATAELTRVVHEALDNRGELMGLLEDAVGRLAELARHR